MQQSKQRRAGNLKDAERNGESEDFLTRGYKETFKKLILKRRAERPIRYCGCDKAWNGQLSLSTFSTVLWCNKH